MDGTWVRAHESRYPKQRSTSNPALVKRAPLKPTMAWVSQPGGPSAAAKARTPPGSVNC